MNSVLYKYSDVLIIGSGVAGLSSALELSMFRPDLRITVLSKSKLTDGSTSLAQGGMAVPVDWTDKQQHFEDTLIAGRYENNSHVVEQFIDGLPKDIEKLEYWGMKFDRRDDGRYSYHLEGGHAIPRVLHCKDHTGLSLHQVLLNNCKQRANIHLIEYFMAYDFQIDDSKIIVNVLDILEGESTELECSRLVLAGGGVGALFHYTTNDALSSGDAVVMALKAGLKITNLSYVQFHPTALQMDTNGHRLPLITEALRGHGAFLLDKNGKRFMFKYDSRGELATRDIISSSIWKEMGTDMEDSVYLDARHIGNVAELFPAVHHLLMSQGYDLRHDLIPVIPAAHYLCGGIECDLNGTTHNPNVYAIGECAHTGLHGRNRLASNSLTEALQMGLNSASEIALNIEKIEDARLPEMKIERIPESNDKKIIQELRRDLSKQLYMIFRDHAIGLAERKPEFGIEEFEILGKLENRYPVSPCLIELRNLIVLGRRICDELKVHDGRHVNAE